MNHDCPNNKAAVINGEYRSGCSKCLNTTQQSSAYANKWRRDRSRENHRADILQRYEGGKLNPEWIKQNEAKAIEDLGIDKVTEVLRG